MMHKSKGNISGDENENFLRTSSKPTEKIFSNTSGVSVKRTDPVVPLLLVSLMANIVFISFIGTYLHEALRRDVEESLTKGKDSICPRHAFLYFTTENNSRDLQKEDVARSTIDLLILVLSARKRQSKDSKMNVKPTRENRLISSDDDNEHSGIHIHSNELNSTRTVTESGYYLTYSHVTLKSFDQGTKVRHRLNRKRQQEHSNTHTTVLMSQQNSLERDRMVFHTSTLVDVVYLQKDDVVYTSVDRMSSIYRMTDANYWGFTKLS